MFTDHLHRQHVRILRNIMAITGILIKYMWGRVMDMVIHRIKDTKWMSIPISGLSGHSDAWILSFMPIIWIILWRIRFRTIVWGTYFRVIGRNSFPPLVLETSSNESGRNITEQAITG